MKKCVISVLSLAAVLAIGIAPIACGPFMLPPFDITIPLMNNVAIDPAIEIIPTDEENTFQFDVPLGAFVSLTDVLDLIRNNEAVPSYLRSRIQVDALKLKNATLDATLGDLSFIQALEIYYVPGSDNAEEPTPILLASIDDTGGSADSVVIQGNPDADFMDILADFEADESENPPHLRVIFAGTMPDDAVVFNLGVTLTVYLMVTI